MTQPQPDDPAFFLAHGPTRAEYLARMADAEWWIFMGLGGVLPARVRETFKMECARIDGLRRRRAEQCQPSKS